MDLKISSKKIYLMALSGIILWFILILIAMFTYAGGTADDPNNVGYAFWGNTFSDLGRTVAWSSQSNLTSMILFSLAYGIHAITMIPFYLQVIKFFSDRNFEYKTSKIGSFFGILASVAIIGIIFTPADILNTPHWIFVYIGYPSLFLMGITYSITLFLSEKFTRNFSYAFIMLFFIFFIALMVGLIGISTSRIIMVIGQKIMRIALLIDLIILIYGIWKLEQN